MTSGTPSQLAQYKLNTNFNGTTVTHTTTTVWSNDKELGSGSFGVVWRQREERSGELRAVKIISKSQSSTQELATLVNLRDVSTPAPPYTTLHITYQPTASTSLRTIPWMV